MHPNMKNKSSIHKNTYIAKTAEICGGGVMLDEGVSIWPQAILRADVKPITIGKFSNIQDQVMIHGTHDSHYHPGGFETIIGANVTIGHKAMIHGAIIDDYCLVGMSSIILDGAKLDKYVYIGAGSLVPPKKHLTTGLWVGSPVKKVRELTEKEIHMIQYSSEHYWKLAQHYKKELAC